ncbi:zinc ribbon domain-containing protein [Halorubrum sp. DTA98]|uniref:zinc ribbon domain-containing protein n=1 Tax=Halorubrum sp. DTA98 TaxID=3402163 RepID=UPI003AAA65F1
MTDRETIGTEHTIVGVDPGVKDIAVAAPLSPHPDQPDAIYAGSCTVKGVLHGFRRRMNYLAEEGGEHWRGEAESLTELGEVLDQQVETAVEQVIAYSRGFEQPAIALEECSYDAPTPLIKLVAGGTEPGHWILPRFGERLEEAAAEADIPLRRVDRDGSSKECHRCGGRVETRWSSCIQCPDADCPVDTADRDRNAAGVLARRLDEQLGEDRCRDERTQPGTLEAVE